MIINENRKSDSYLGTFNLSDINDMKMVMGIRRMVKDANEHLRDSDSNTKSLYVKLHGRGHRMGIRRYNQSLPLEFSKTADAYVYLR